MISTNVFIMAAYQTNARNPGNSVAATNPVFDFDLLMSYNDINLQIENINSYTNFKNSFLIVNVQYVILSK